MKRFAKLLPLLLLSALLCACQPQSEAPSSSAFSVTFANHSSAEVSVLEVYLSDSNDLIFPSSRYFISTSIHAPGRDSGDTTPMIKGETYSSVPFSAGTTPALSGEGAPEEVTFYFELDGKVAGKFSATVSQLWGHTVACQLDSEGRFSAQLTETA